MRPKGVADAQTVEIPSPPKDLNAGTLLDSGTRALVDPGERERNYSSEVRDAERREKL